MTDRQMDRETDRTNKATGTDTLCEHFKAQNARKGKENSKI